MSESTSQLYSNNFWKKYNWSQYSHNGEDGIIYELFRRLGIGKGGWVCEFGAWDGINSSNTFFLVKYMNFKAVYIEGDENKYDALLKTADLHKNIIPINAYVDHDINSLNSLDSILSKTDIPVDFDLLSIDIDGFDYQVWDSLTKYKPKIVIIEINSSVDPYDLSHIHQSNVYKGTGFRPMFNLGIKKDYKFVLHCGNMFFVRNDLYNKLNFSYVNELENFNTYCQINLQLLINLLFSQIKKKENFSVVQEGFSSNDLNKVNLRKSIQARWDSMTLEQKNDFLIKYQELVGMGETEKATALLVNELDVALSDEHVATIEEATAITVEKHTPSPTVAISTPTPTPIVAISTPTVNIPIIILHIGNQEYLQIVIQQAESYNNDVILIGDDSNKGFCEKHYDYHQLEDESSKLFGQIYKHISPNNLEFEGICIQRWFIIHNLMKKLNIEKAFICDSDILFFCNINQIVNNYYKKDIYISTSSHKTHSVTAGQSIWTIEKLKEFTDYILEFYKNSDWNYITNYWNNLVIKSEIEKLTGISDMYLLYCFLTKTNFNDNHFNFNGDKLSIDYDLSQTVDDSFFDNSIDIDSDYFGINKWEQEFYDFNIPNIENKIKKFSWYNGLPYCYNKNFKKKFRVNSIHFHGCKEKIKEYFYVSKKNMFCMKNIIESAYKIVPFINNEYIGSLKQIINKTLMFGYLEYHDDDLKVIQKVVSYIDIIKNENKNLLIDFVIIESFLLNILNNYILNYLNEFPIDSLRCYESDMLKIRVGKKNDGGYVIVDKFNYDILISAGIADDDSFEIEFTNKYNVNCIAYDGTINEFPHPNLSKIKFFKKNISVNNSNTTTNLHKLIDKYNNIFLKMDIESSEYEWINTLNDEQLNKISQIAIEFHHPFDISRWKCLEKLSCTHYLLHFHGNNYCGNRVINNINIHNVFECTYVRKSNFTHKLNYNTKPYPHEIDMLNDSQLKDIVLDYYPFVSENKITPYNNLQKIIENKTIGLKKMSFIFLCIKKYNVKSDLKLSELFDHLDNFSILDYNLIVSENSYADPFLFEHNGYQYIFCEEEHNHKGRIVYLRLNEYNNICDKGIALDLSKHLSYPYIFEDDNEIYMIPEQCSTYKLELYKCIEFPDKWKSVYTLIEGDTFVDSNLIKYNGYYWIITTNILGKLYIIYSKHLLHSWNLHPICKKSVNINKYGDNRNAGTVKLIDNKIYRFTQRNVNNYGESLLIKEINLTLDDYSEIDIKYIDKRIHHIDFNNNLLILDYNIYRNQYFEEIYKFNEINEWWSGIADRVYQKDIYQNIHKYINIEKIKLLDIGFEPYNHFNYFMFPIEQENFEYHVIDIKNNIDESFKKYYKFINKSILDFQDDKYHNYFNIVLSMGVLGYCKFITEDIDLYLYNVFNLLNDEKSLFILKLDNLFMNGWEDKYKITESHIYKYFKNKVDPIFIKDNNGTLYHTIYILNKKEINLCIDRKLFYTKQSILNEIEHKLETVTQILENNNIEYIIACGTLLGAVRHEHIITWDTDCDLIVHHKYKSNMYKIKNLLNKVNLDFDVKGFETNHIQIGRDLHDHTVCDIWFYYYDENNKYFNDDEKVFMNNFLYKNEMYPLKKYIINNKYYYGPNNYEKYLTRFYGDYNIKKIYNHFMIPSKFSISENNYKYIDYIHPDIDEVDCKIIINILSNNDNLDDKCKSVIKDIETFKNGIELGSISYINNTIDVPNKYKDIYQITIEKFQLFYLNYMLNIYLK